VSDAVKLTTPDRVVGDIISRMEALPSQVDGDILQFVNAIDGCKRLSPQAKAALKTRANQILATFGKDAVFRVDTGSTLWTSFLRDFRRWRSS
jgi:hypothetical protein